MATRIFIKPEYIKNFSNSRKTVTCVITLDTNDMVNFEDADNFVSNVWEHLEPLEFLYALLIYDYKIDKVESLPDEDVVDGLQWVETPEDIALNKMSAIIAKKELKARKQQNKELRIQDTQNSVLSTLSIDSFKRQEVRKDTGIVDISFKGLKTPVEFDVSTLYAFFSLKGLINTAKNDTTARIAFGNDENPVIELRSTAHWSMIANQIDIYNTAELNGRKPSIFDQVEAGVIFSEQHGRPTIVIADRRRTFQCTIDTIEFVKTLHEKGLLNGQKLDIVSLLTQSTEFNELMTWSTPLLEK